MRFIRLLAATVAAIMIVGCGTTEDGYSKQAKSTLDKVLEFSERVVVLAGNSVVDLAKVYGECSAFDLDCLRIEMMNKMSSYHGEIVRLDKMKEEIDKDLINMKPPDEFRDFHSSVVDYYNAATDLYNLVKQAHKENPMRYPEVVNGKLKNIEFKLKLLNDQIRRLK